MFYGITMLKFKMFDAFKLSIPPTNACYFYCGGSIPFVFCLYKSSQACFLMGKSPYVDDSWSPFLDLEISIVQWLNHVKSPFLEVEIPHSPRMIFHVPHLFMLRDSKSHRAFAPAWWATPTSLKWSRPRRSVEGNGSTAIIEGRC